MWSLPWPLDCTHFDNKGSGSFVTSLLLELTYHRFKSSTLALMPVFLVRSINLCWVSVWSINSKNWFLGPSIFEVVHRTSIPLNWSLDSTFKLVHKIFEVFQWRFVSFCLVLIFTLHVESTTYMTWNLQIAPLSFLFLAPFPRHTRR